MDDRPADSEGAGWLKTVWAREEMAVSQDNKLIAKYAWKAFGGKPIVQNYLHDTEPLSMDILRCENRPSEGLTSYATIGLSDSPMMVDGKEFPTRLELAGVCAAANDLFPNVLASCGFCISKSKELFCPGSILFGAIEEYYPAASVPHLLLTTPFLWEDALKTYRLESKIVTWLLGVPISNQEALFLKQNSFDALEILFEKRDIDIYDLGRPSAV